MMVIKKAASITGKVSKSDITKLCQKETTEPKSEKIKDKKLQKPDSVILASKILNAGAKAAAEPIEATPKTANLFLIADILCSSRTRDIIFLKSLSYLSIALAYKYEQRTLFGASFDRGFD